MLGGRRASVEDAGPMVTQHLHLNLIGVRTVVHI